MKWPIERRVQLGLAIAGVVLCSLGLITYAQIASFERTSDLLIHTHLVIETIEGARTGLDDAETSVRGYLLTRDPAFLRPYELVHGRIPGVIQRLRLFTTDNPVQQQKVAQVKTQVDRELELMQQAVNAAKAPATSAAEQEKLLNEDQQVMSSLRNTFRVMRLQENELLSTRNTAWRLNLTEAITAGAFLVVLSLFLLISTYYVFKRDLFERRRAEAALHASEQRLRSMISSVTDYAFFMVGPEGRVASWNEGAAIIKGYQANEIIGQPFSVFFSDEDQKAGTPELHLKRAAEKGSAENEGWRVRKDGSRFWANAVASAMRDEEGVLVGFAEVARDLTERKLAEEKIRQGQSRLAAILDGSPSAIFVKDPDGRYTLVNRRFEECFQVNREQVLGKTDRELFPPDTARQLGEHDLQAFKAKKALEFEELIRQKNGPHSYLSARVPLVNENQEVFALCGISTDITERKEKEKEIQRLNRALQDRVVDHSVELMKASDHLKIERELRQTAEARERDVLERLLEVMQAGHIPAWVYDLETMALLDFNNAAVTLHGSSREELSKMRITEIFSVLPEVGNGNDFANGPIPSRQSAKNGRKIPLELLARPVEWKGSSAVLVMAVSAAEDHVSLPIQAADAPA